MKKFFYLLFLLFPVCISAQDLHLAIGPSFSLLKYTSTYTILSTIDNKSFTGFNVMAGVDYLKLKYFNLSSELGFIQKGGKDSVMATDAEGYGIARMWCTTKLNFLTVNSTANLRIPFKGYIYPYAFLGPRLDYLTGYTENVDLVSQFDAVKKLNKLIYGVIIGAGIDFKVKKFLLSIVFDYYFNLDRLVYYHYELPPDCCSKSDKSVNITSDDIFYKLIDRTFTINARIGYIFK
ncbi:MAG: porin family protein [Bacteroidales bacterium]|jgi:hypothetical protein